MNEERQLSMKSTKYRLEYKTSKTGQWSISHVERFPSEEAAFVYLSHVRQQHEAEGWLVSAVSLTKIEHEVTEIPVPE